MNRIIAEREGGTTITVEESNGIVTVYDSLGDVDGFFKTVLDGVLDSTEPMGGTFYPKKGTMLAYYHVLKNSWFSSEIKKLTVEGDIGEMPHEEGVIY